MSEHPMQPTPEQIREWLDATTCRRDHLRLAYCAGADAQLEACCEWNSFRLGSRTAVDLRAAMRPKPPSLAESALEALGNPYRLDLSDGQIAVVLSALARLAELEALSDD